MNAITFNRIKSSGRLFTDYLYDFPKVSMFYTRNPFRISELKPHLEKLSSRNVDRKKLSQILERQNKHFGASPQTLENIGKLESLKTTAVVTGQQVGLFGGPLYTVYKALAAVLWCQKYKAQFPDYDFVPIFWMELEDHDFEEIRHIKLYSMENDVRKLSYELDNSSKTPIFKIRIGSEAERIFSELKATMNKTDFTDAWSLAIEQSYSPGFSFGVAFGKFLTWLLGDLGLILMDPSDIEFKKLARPVFKKEIEHADETYRRINQDGERLRKSGYELQVDVQPVNFFLHDEGPSKHPLNSEKKDKFRLKPEIMEKHREDILLLLENHPEKFIPNVALRPMVQDYLLPTAAYIGGPAEMAYFGQFKSLYEFFDVPQPVILPRPFMTLLEKKIVKILEKYSIDPLDVMNDIKAFREDVTVKNAAIPIGSLFEHFDGVVEKEMKQLQENLSKVDASLKGAAETALQKIQQAVSVLRTKTTEAEKRRNETLLSQIEKAVNHIYPDGNFQEREINILYFLNKYGSSLVSTLADKIDLSTNDHQFIEL